MPTKKSLGQNCREILNSLLVVGAEARIDSEHLFLKVAEIIKTTNKRLLKPIDFLFNFN